jgi:DNA replication protein DnaC
MTYDIVADDPTDEELAYLELNAPQLATGHYDYCPTCNKLGVYQYQGVKHACDCATQLALAQHYTLAGIPADYHRLDWSDFTEELPVDVQDYRDNLQAFVHYGMGLLLVGSRGLGKTMLLTLVLKDCVKLGLHCYATTFNTTVDQLTAGWGPGDEAQAAAARFRKRFQVSDVLLLDDLGKEFKAANKIAATTFDNVLRTRVQNNRPTLLSSNLSVDGITTGYGESVLSLLLQKVMLVRMEGQDYRFQAGQRIRDLVRSQETRPIV